MVEMREEVGISDAMIELRVWDLCVDKTIYKDRMQLCLGYLNNTTQIKREEQEASLNYPLNVETHRHKLRNGANVHKFHNVHKEDDMEVHLNQMNSRRGGIRENRNRGYANQGNRQPKARRKPR